MTVIFSIVEPSGCSKYLKMSTNDVHWYGLIIIAFIQYTSWLSSERKKNWHLLQSPYIVLNVKILFSWSPLYPKRSPNDIHCNPMSFILYLISIFDVYIQRAEKIVSILTSIFGLHVFLNVCDLQNI